MNILPPPGRARNQQLAVLVVLVGALIYFGRDLLRSAPTETAQAASNSTAPEAKAPEPLAVPEPLALASLEPVGEAPGSGRNPFRFGVPPPPPRPPQPAYTPPPPAPYVPPPQPTGPPPPPPIQLQFKGMDILPGSTKRRAILFDQKGNVFKGGEGDVIDGRYRIVKLGETSLIIEYLDGTGRIQLRYQ